MRDYRTDASANRRPGISRVVAALMMCLLLPILASCGGSGGGAPDYLGS